MPYATGKFAYAECDICGMRCKYTDLVKYIYNQRWTGQMVHPRCYDDDNPQLQVGKNFRPEAMALLNGRPDTGLAASRALFGWNPILGLVAQYTMGRVTTSGG
mgnify:CR=1 FL=1